MTTLGAMMLASALCTSLGAQWINYPTPVIPRTPEGKPNLTARAPKTSDGKTDSQRIWQFAQSGYSAISLTTSGPKKPGHGREPCTINAVRILELAFAVTFRTRRGEFPPIFEMASAAAARVFSSFSVPASSAIRR